MTSVEGVPACLLTTVPVVQPPHLEGDPSLATEILPGPPSLQSIQQGLARKDHKKLGPAFSYLPVSDPGTTYGGHMVTPMTTAPNEVDGPRRKRARLDKTSATSRAQRASARNLTALGAPEASIPLESVASTSQLIPDSDPLAPGPDSDDAMMSGSNSVPPGEEVGYNASNARARREKGKDKERDSGVRVKDEPVAFALQSFEPSPALPNEDHCSACRSFGSLVYCDGCPRAYHLWCLNPPMEASDLPEGDSRWFCPACIRRQNPPPKPLASLKFMAPLITHVQTILPSEYQLPLDIRTFFKDVGTSSRGTYVDTSEIKPPRLNRHGQLEDREPYRLKDRNGEPILCFKCGTSALPRGVAAAAPAAKRARRSTSALASNSESSGRMIISCDYCHLNWHLDCLDPPLSYMPPWGRKWMCPNHAEQILKLKKRIPRQSQPIEVTKPGQFNNGNIEIIHPELSPIVQSKVAVDEVLINGRRYRVPERVITMDFWNKANGKGEEIEVESEVDHEMSSGLSSPLTELSSLSEIEETPQPSVPKVGLFDMDELKAALFLCHLQNQTATSSTESAKHTKDTELDVSERDMRAKTKDGPLLESKVTPLANGISKGEQSLSKRQSRASSARVASTKVSKILTPQPAATGTRSRSKRPAVVEQSDDPIEDVPPSFSVPVLRGSRSKSHHQDAFPASLSLPSRNGVDGAESISGGPQQTASTPTEEPSSSRTSTRPKRTRQAPRKTPIPVTGVHPSSRMNGTASESDGDTPKRSPDPVEEQAPVASSSRPKPLPSQPAQPPRKRGRPKGSTTKPVTSAPGKNAVPTTPSVPVKTDPGVTTTPSLKIRLPRLGSLNQQTNVAPAVSNDIEIAGPSSPPSGRRKSKRAGQGTRVHQRSHPRQTSSSRTSATDVPL
ncbi:unnamed protein product [Somion occarium]|uniref:PHD-type domain-containing protein n=1 Tax=Somion occarium TaxID=3059160 RepID=A0ABP1DA12_9APHY